MLAVDVARVSELMQQLLLLACACCAALVDCLLLSEGNLLVTISGMAGSRKAYFEACKR